MEFFRDAYSVRLMSHTGKYLWADEDKKSVAQKRGKDAYGVIWRVELVSDRNAVRLKSVYDLYLMASDYAFLFGATGKKVLQSFASKADSSLEWEPIAAGTFVKLMTKGEKFLRANWNVPMYRNSVTHDVPVLAGNQHVVFWEVEVVRKRDAPSLTPNRLSPRQSNASRPKSPSPPPPLPAQQESSHEEEESPPPLLVKTRVRANPSPSPVLESSDDETPSPPLPRQRARPNRRRDKSYSSSSSEQGSPPRAQRRQPSPPSEALRTTHIDRRRDARYDDSPPRRPREGYATEGGGSGYRAAPAREGYTSSASEGGYRVAAARRRAAPVEYESSQSGASTPRRSADGEERGSRDQRSGDVRRIFYSVAEDDGEVLAHDDESFGTFMFRGQSLEELTHELQRVTGIREDIILCMRNPLSAKLYKMRLALPQNNAPLSVVIVRSSSQFGRTFSSQTPVRRR